MAFHPQSNSGYFNPIIRRFSEGEDRWIYAGRLTASAGLDCIDMSLATAANYLGGGSWTTTPRIPVSGLTSRAVQAVGVNPVSLHCIRMGSDGAFDVIDVNPASGTYHTQIFSGQVPDGYNIRENVVGCSYNPFLDAFVIVCSGTQGVVVLWRYPNNIVIKPDFSLGKSYSRAHFNQYNGDVILTGGQQEHSLILRVLKNLTVKQIGIIDGDQLHFSFSKNFPNGLFGYANAAKTTYGAIKLFDINDYRSDDLSILSTISVSGTLTGISRNSFFEKRQTAYYVFGLTVYEVNCQNPKAISVNTSHTRTAVGSENSVNYMTVSERYQVLAILGRNSSGGNLVCHFYDISSSLTYIGYVALGGTNTSARAIATVNPYR